MLSPSQVHSLEVLSRDKKAHLFQHLADVVAYAPIKDPMTCIDSQTIFHSATAWRLEVWGKGRKVIKDWEAAAESKSFYLLWHTLANYNAAFHHGNLGFSHADTSPLNTFITVEPRGISPPLYSARIFSSHLHAEKHNHSNIQGLRWNTTGKTVFSCNCQFGDSGLFSF